ncbi:thiol peroxidase [Snodgrassella sp. CFCC 13594]|uniref:thiol peroxidase n=1 Tax=Snodgrassella sp. CFCC 13594 TaxID=1775559 RepID=UPI00082AA57A|nr:thiol peroxidase [Snodgrassella sp. CFCC 13594]
MSQVTFKGTPIEVNGHFPEKSEQAAEFELTTIDLTAAGLGNYAGKRKVLNIFPSVDTGVCAASVRRFNQEATALKDTVVLCISADLPFAQARFCGAEGIDNVVMLSTFRSPSFKTDYGVDISTGPLAGLCARAVVVLDANNQVLYAERVAEIANEPDYATALSVL